MSATDILKVVPTIQATGLVGTNLKKLKKMAKKKAKTKDMVELGVSNIISAEMIKETSKFVN